MTEPRHFHSARKGSGSLRPFPIYPLYTQAEILSLDKPIADCFLFRPRKNRKSAGNAVIPTFPTRWSHGLQHLRHKRRTFAFTPESGYTLGFAQRIAHSGLHAETGAVSDRGCYHYPRSVPHVHKHPRAGCQNGKLCRFWGLDLVYSRRTQRACGTAMRSCASLFRGVAAPLGCVIPLLFLLPH